MVGREARSRGFNVMLAGGINLARDPRNGRNFEYLSEDPLLSAVLAAEAINGIQGEGVISTIKHYSLNCNETNRHWLDAIIDPAAHRESDLLAFEIAIERARARLGHDRLQQGQRRLRRRQPRSSSRTILKGAWGYPGWVMSDWGATPTWDFALDGLDQESGAQIDVMMWEAESFTEPLRRRVRRRRAAQGAPLRDGAPHPALDVRGRHRPLGPGRPAPGDDMAAHNADRARAARQGIVLLKNDGVLPLAADTTARIAVIGGYAQLGVPIGTGSSAVIPPGGYASRDPDRRPRDHGQRAQPLPPAVVAAAGAAASCCPTRRSSSTPA